MSQPQKFYKDPQLPDQPKLPAPVQDLSLAQLGTSWGWPCQGGDDGGGQQQGH